MGQYRQAQHLVDPVALLRLQLVQVVSSDERVVTYKGVAVVLQTLYVGSVVPDALELILDGPSGLLDLWSRLIGIATGSPMA